MNWTRGLWRAWIVFTVAWLIVVGVIAAATWPTLKPWDLDPPVDDKLAELDRLVTAAEHKERVTNQVLFAAGFGIGIPAALLIAGWSSLWIARGFKSS